MSQTLKARNCQAILDWIMIRELYFLLSLLQYTSAAAEMKEWKAVTPQNVTTQRGLCAQIPCHYPSYEAHATWTGIWINDGEPPTIVFHSKQLSKTAARFRQRTQLSGDLKDGDCSLIIDNVMQEDEGSYIFKVEVPSKDSYISSVTRLHVSNFTDKPSIFAAEMVPGKPMNIKCTFNTTCERTTPTLTWITPADIPTSNSSSVTQKGNTLIYTSFLKLTPELKHHGQKLICRVSYPLDSSEQTLILTVQNESATIWKKVLITVGIIFCIALAGFFIYRYIQKREEKRAPEIKESTVIYSPPFGIHQDTEHAAAQGYTKVPAGRNIGQGEPPRHEGPLYAQLQELPCRDTMVPKIETTEYASIRFQ
ncbi:myeloid cell surface antigen CD33-like isoform X1 [Mobula birostris]|uniref:myeloid cell surface antigen CD33-like isoform X1 n=1 Tax=Mobula birostris TaxID=1983395 RepID=UPI003B27D8B5